MRRSACKFFALHGEWNEFIFSEWVSQQGIYPIDSPRRTSSTATDSASCFDAFFNFNLKPKDVSTCSSRAHSDTRYIFFRCFGCPPSMRVMRTPGISLFRTVISSPTRSRQNQVHQATRHIGYCCRCKNGYFFH